MWKSSAHDRGGFLVQHRFEVDISRLRLLNPALRVSNLKDVLALISMPNILRDTQKDCGKPGCLNDYRIQVLARGDEMIVGAVLLRTSFAAAKRSLAISAPTTLAPRRAANRDVHPVPVARSRICSPGFGSRRATQCSRAGAICLLTTS